MFPRILPPLPNGLGTGVDGFKPPEVVVGVEVEPPNRPPPVVDVVAVVVVPGVGVVEAAPKSVPPGLELKMFPGAVVVVPDLLFQYRSCLCQWRVSKFVY